MLYEWIKRLNGFEWHQSTRLLFEAVHRIQSCERRNGVSRRVAFVFREAGDPDTFAVLIQFSIEGGHITLAGPHSEGKDGYGWSAAGFGNAQTDVWFM